jgi:hypothetical protein
MAMPAVIVVMIVVVRFLRSHTTFLLQKRLK